MFSAEDNWQDYVDEVNRINGISPEDCAAHQWASSLDVRTIQDGMSEVAEVDHRLALWFVPALKASRDLIAEDLQRVFVNKIAEDAFASLKAYEDLELTPEEREILGETIRRDMPNAWARLQSS